MIERIVLSHVRCFESVDVPLKPLTVLIGPNNTGKSTFLTLLETASRERKLDDSWKRRESGSSSSDLHLFVDEYSDYLRWIDGRPNHNRALMAMAIRLNDDELARPSVGLAAPLSTPLSLRCGHETRDGVTPLTVYFLADGPRDFEALRRLTERFLGRTIDHFQNECWRDIKLTRGRGFDRKLEYVVRRLQRNGNHDGSGVVAMVDQDNADPRKRLQELVAGRAVTRQDLKATIVATAVGEARPNFDALLVDCRRAVADGRGTGAEEFAEDLRREWASR